MKLHLKPLIFLFFWSTLVIGQSYFPPSSVAWEEKDPNEFKIDEGKLETAITFAKDNEYSGSRDLRIAVLKGFSHEPYHKIMGPTKKRGGPAGMILKNGYRIASWGDIDRKVISPLWRV